MMAFDEVLSMTLARYGRKANGRRSKMIRRGCGEDAEIVRKTSGFDTAEKKSVISS